MKSCWLTILLVAVASAQVTQQDLLNTDKTPQQWLTYNGNYEGHRHSALKEISSSNAAGLRLKWVFQKPFNHKFETTPLVVDNIMYLTVPPNEV